MTATGSTVFVVEIQALQKLLAEKDAEIQRLKEYVTQVDKALFEFGKHAGEMAKAKDAKIERLRNLSTRAADALAGMDPKWEGDWSTLIAELRKATE